MKLQLIFPKRLVYKYTILEEISPAHFPFLIKILNDERLMKYYRDTSIKVTMETQKAWYDNYLKQDKRYYIVKDRTSGYELGTVGITYYDEENNNVIGGWLLMNKYSRQYRPLHLIDMRIGLLRYAFASKINNIYGYVNKKSTAIKKLHSKFGYLMTGEISYPSYLPDSRRNKVLEMKLSAERFKRRQKQIMDTYRRLENRKDLNTNSSEV